ncbi:uncharacterized protein IUM83_06542 [Phytophthora cinnamomi]|uniref:uncharacterized protein n=1 Tax=Phytophthora cinnamomi TaxID=4785 RepID=UPI00355A3BE5|nr:hypothetical protein IUM83_06542 [Phytophthora cinnamomi]
MAEKRRKSTVTKRKEEINDLKAEVRKLRSELELQNELRELQVVPVRTPPLGQVASENVVLTAAIHGQQLGVARAHSTLPPPLLSGWRKEGSMAK